MDPVCADTRRSRRRTTARTRPSRRREGGWYHPAVREPSIWTTLREELEARARLWSETADRLAQDGETAALAQRCAEMAAGLLRVRDAVTEQGIVVLPARPELAGDDRSASSLIGRDHAERLVTFAKGEFRALNALLRSLLSSTSAEDGARCRKVIGFVMGAMYVEVIRTIALRFPDLDVQPDE